MSVRSHIETASISEVSAEDVADFRAGLRLFFEAHSPEPEVRRLLNDPVGFEASTWSRLGRELGTVALGLPEELGGWGASLEMIAVLVEEAARALYSGPTISTALLAPTALRPMPPTPQRDDVIAGMLDGTVVSVLLEQPGLDPVRASSGGRGRALLSGRCDGVLDAPIAERFLIVARDNEEAGLFLVEALAPGCLVEQSLGLDMTRRLGAVTMNGAEAVYLGGMSDEDVQTLLDVAVAATATELMAVSGWAAAIATSYAQTREQFGQKIGSFQAVKHLCVDMHTAVESQSAATSAAWRALQGHDPAAAEAVSIAKAYGSVTGPAVCETAIQVLGGVGFTWEHPAHLYLRRAKTLQFMLGDAQVHRARLGAIAGLTAPHPGSRTTPVRTIASRILVDSPPEPRREDQ